MKEQDCLRLERGIVDVACDFCAEQYGFDKIDVEIVIRSVYRKMPNTLR